MSDACYIRPFEREGGDHAMICEWWRWHGAMPVPLVVLPALGVVAYRPEDAGDCAALWLYMDNSCGVCFVEHAVTAPGLRPKAASGALLAALDFLKQEAVRLNYAVMLMRTSAAIARFAEKSGFERGTGNLVTLYVGLEKENK